MKTKNVLYTLVGIVAVVLLFLGARWLVSSKNEGFVSDHSTFTLYYADWCPHCKTVKPIFQQWSKSGQVSVNGKSVNAQMMEADANADEISKAGVKGFPTFILSKPDGSSVEYKGDRSVSAWEEWLSTHA